MSSSESKGFENDTEVGSDFESIYDHTSSTISSYSDTPPRFEENSLAIRKLWMKKFFLLVFGALFCLIFVCVLTTYLFLRYDDVKSKRIEIDPEILVWRNEDDGLYFHERNGKVVFWGYSSSDPYQSPFLISDGDEGRSRSIFGEIEENEPDPVPTLVRPFKVIFDQYCCPLGDKNRIAGTDFSECTKIVEGIGGIVYGKSEEHAIQSQTFHYYELNANINQFQPGKTTNQVLMCQQRGEVLEAHFVEVRPMNILVECTGRCTSADMDDFERKNADYIETVIGEIENVERLVRYYYDQELDDEQVQLELKAIEKMTDLRKFLYLKNAVLAELHHIAQTCNKYFLRGEYESETLYATTAGLEGTFQSEILRNFCSLKTFEHIKTGKTYNDVCVPRDGSVCIPMEIRNVVTNDGTDLY